ncbi:MAG: B12-binding domain-containing radical SAM protein [Candidatus Muirbacterium halophilum]|nr:B12-binding domain-containing radical SAM protein [Candidatus Muirbacterium halophilum]MCK9474361.1 B12-binding domain-containing radical SAM protein [Candidatus Muirbacterium halophilum]
MRILLINQPDRNTLIANNPEILEESRGYNPPLGLLYIASSLKNAGMDVQVLDCQVEELNYKQLKKRIETIKPDVVGMTLMTFCIFDVKKTAQLCKSINPNIKIILGGPHIYIYPEETARLSWVDAVLIGEADFTAPDFFKNINNEELLKKVPGACFVKKDGNIHKNPPPPLIENLDTVQFPARELTFFKKYNSVIAKRTPVTTMFTSRGCPYKCLFCDRPHLGDKFRARTAKNVVDEIEKCYEMGINEFLIYDDTFTIIRERVVEICEILIKKNLHKKIGWDVRARVNTVDYELLCLMKKAGCERIHYGVESGSEKILKVLRKGITLEQALKVFKETKKAKIQTLAYFMIGSPEETVEDVEKTIKFMKKLNPDYVHVTITSPFPATELYFLGLKNNVFKKDIWKEFAQNPNKDFIPPHWNEIISEEKLHSLVKKAYKSFYFRPFYLLKRVLSVRSFGEFKRKAKAGIGLLFYK